MILLEIKLFKRYLDHLSSSPSLCEMKSVAALAASLVSIMLSRRRLPQEPWNPVGHWQAHLVPMRVSESAINRDWLINQTTLFTKRNAGSARLHFFWGRVYISEPDIKLLLRPFDKIDMTPRQGQWPRINRINGWIKPAFLLVKSVGWHSTVKPHYHWWARESK